MFSLGCVFFSALHSQILGSVEANKPSLAWVIRERLVEDEVKAKRWKQEVVAPEAEHMTVDHEPWAAACAIVD